jgi:hypothetical protein
MGYNAGPYFSFSEGVSLVLVQSDARASMNVAQRMCPKDFESFELRGDQTLGCLAGSAMVR